jgi:very-short-patch-repair endonuclease
VGDTAISRARQLRRDQTPHELTLWRELRQLRTQGFHVRRQAPFRGYVLDFVCFSRRVVVELDGGQHTEVDHIRHDAVRDAVLKREGFVTLRFWNAEIDDNLDGVVETIWRTLAAAVPHPARQGRATLPTEGEG